MRDVSSDPPPSVPASTDVVQTRIDHRFMLAQIGEALGGWVTSRLRAQAGGFVSFSLSDVVRVGGKGVR